MYSKPKGYACPRCTVGRCTAQTTTYADICYGELLCIPNAPAYICDVCYFVEFEQELLDALWQELYVDMPMEEAPPTARQKRSSAYGEESN